MVVQGREGAHWDIRRVGSGGAAGALVLVLTATGLALVGAPTVLAGAGSNPVATTTMTFVDTSRPTPPWDGIRPNPPEPL